MSEAMALRAADAVRPERLLARHHELASIGAIEPVGLNREAFTEADIEARRLVLSWAAARDYETSMDGIGNLFIRRHGRQSSAEPVVTGSHLDSQPAGGPYDGQFGVLAACETLEALDDAGIATEWPVDVVVWANEEGSRFQPTTMGSAVFAGALPLALALAATDSRGLTLAAELGRLMASLAISGRREFGSPFRSYVEAHIEQGPILERTGRPLGVVTAIQGLRWFTIRVRGRTGHAGTTPAADRRDALMAATRMISALAELMADADDAVRFTVGRFDVHPNSPNTIPDEVLFTVDFRHPKSEVLAKRGDEVERVCREHAGPCDVVVEETLDAPPTFLDAGLASVIRDAADVLGVAHSDIVSGATHDAKYAALHSPSAMLFIRCRDGVSHTVLEYASPDDMTTGTRVLAATIATLATS